MPSATGTVVLDRISTTSSSPLQQMSPLTPLSNSIPNMRRASNLPLSAFGGVNGSSQKENVVPPQSPAVSTPTAPVGKTSQVIERLTGEADRLRRELRAEKAAREEAVQETQAMKGRIAYLEEQNNTLSSQCAANDTALARKERRLDDLRARVDQGEARRKAAEQQAQAMSRELEDTVTRTQQELSEAKNKEKFAEAAYSTIRQSYNALEGRIKLLRGEVASFQKRIDEQREAHLAQVTRLEVLLDQQRQSHEGSEKQVKAMAAVIASYRVTEENVQKLEKEMQDTILEMRWAMRLHKSREGGGGD